MLRNRNIVPSRISLALVIAVLLGILPGLGHARAAQDEGPPPPKPTIIVQEFEHLAVFFVKYHNAAVELSFIHPISDEHFRPSALADGDELIIQAQFDTASVVIQITNTDREDASIMTLGIPEATAESETTPWEFDPTCTTPDATDDDSPDYHVNVKGLLTPDNVFVIERCKSAGVVPDTSLLLDQKALRKEVRSWMSYSDTLTSDGNIVSYEAKNAEECPDFRIPLGLELTFNDVPVGLFNEAFQATFNYTSGNDFLTLSGACIARFFFTVIPWENTE